MLLQRGSRGCCCKASSGICQRLCSHGTGFLHFLQRKLLNSLYLMFKWTTGTETPAPSFPCSKEQQEQQAGSVCPLQALGEGQEGNASPQQQPLCPKQGTSGGSHPSFGCREQDTAPGHGGSTPTAPQLPRHAQSSPRGQPGWVIQGRAALISSQSSRITACQGCLESSNMVSVPTASQGCSTTPLRGLTQHPCSSGMPGEGGLGKGRAGNGPWVHGTLIQPGPTVRAGIQQQEPRV